MKTNDKLHILNGQAMYDHFQKTGFLRNEMIVPFNEAMCHGDTTSNVFSDDFISTRAKVHHVTSAEYKEITMKPLHPLFNQTFEKIELWFDDDMFCQINILTILAWLDQVDYAHIIKLHIVDDQFKQIDSFTLKAQNYHKIYTLVLLDKIMPEHLEIPPLKRGVELYLTYLDPKSDLMTFIQKHKDTPEQQLLTKLLTKFKHYGLGDTQYLEIIRGDSPPLC